MTNIGGGGAGGLSRNPSITPEFIEKHIDKNWDWGRLSLSVNPSITPEFVEKHIGKDWWWGIYGLSSNPSITSEFIEKHIDHDWQWGYYGLSSNPSITPEFIEKHIDKDWDWGRCGLSHNTFSISIERQRRIESAVRIIQKKYLEWYYKPVCKDGTYGLHFNTFKKVLDIDNTVCD